jgi:hypothetical protein
MIAGDLATLPAAERTRLAQLVRLVSSDHDGEALGAARALGWKLRTLGCDFDDLAKLVEAPTPVPRVTAPPTTVRSLGNF